MIRPGRKIIAGGAIAALSAALVLGGCSGTDVSINAPILEAVGLNFIGKKADDPDLPDRPGLVIPPNANNLPQPGARDKNSQQAWPVDKDENKKTAKQLAAEKEKEYCEKGDWSGKGNIEEFNKNTGQQQRCGPEWIKKALKKPGQE